VGARILGEHERDHVTSIERIDADPGSGRVESSLKSAAELARTGRSGNNHKW